MKNKNLIFTSICLIIFFVFLNTTVFSEGDDYDSENGNEEYRTGKELAYDGNYKAAIVYLNKYVSNVKRKKKQNKFMKKLIIKYFQLKN